MHLFLFYLSDQCFYYYVIAAERMHPFVCHWSQTVLHMISIVSIVIGSIWPSG